MRHVAVTTNFDGVPTKINLRKLPRQRRFQAIIQGQTTEYVISDATNAVEYFDGPVLDERVHKFIIQLIGQYFANSRAIQKIGEEDYQDYDDY